MGLLFGLKQFSLNQSRCLRISIRRHSYQNQSTTPRTSLTTNCYSSVIPYLSVTQLQLESKVNDFDDVIDVRTPAEYSEDRVPDAVNVPVLDNDQRVMVGTLYKSNRLEARRQGAALISRNIAGHLENFFREKPLNYKPLIYCWRGGQRSRSLAIILKEIGFHPTLLEGGYKEYRKLVRSKLFDESPGSIMNKFKIIKISGPTGCGKSLLLETLEKRGEQILHLEQLANHKGSVLGQYPGAPQPSQKMFETLLYQHLETKYTPEKVIWVENESSKIGKVIIPLGLWRKMLQSPRIQLNVDLEDRIQFILKDYDYFCQENSKNYLLNILKDLERYAGKKKSLLWSNFVENNQYKELVTDLIVNYYDLNYKKPLTKPKLTFQVPKSLILQPGNLLNSRLVDDLLNFGDKSMLCDKEDIIDNEIKLHL